MNPFAVAGLYFMAPWVIAGMVMFAVIEQMEAPSWT